MLKEKIVYSTHGIIPVVRTQTEPKPKGCEQRPNKLTTIDLIRVGLINEDSVSWFSTGLVKKYNLKRKMLIGQVRGRYVLMYIFKIYTKI